MRDLEDTRCGRLGAASSTYAARDATCPRSAGYPYPERNDTERQPHEQASSWLEAPIEARLSRTPLEVELSASVPHTPERRVAANGIDICYDTFGDPAAPPLLLIMGLGCQMVQWDDDFCATLASRGFHVIRFDNRDVGRSTWLDAAGVPDILGFLLGQRQTWGNTPYLLRDMAQDAVGLLEAHGISRAHIVGASMGGAIAQEIAFGHPDRVLTLTCIMASSGEPGAPPTPDAMEVLTRRLPEDTLQAYAESFARTWKVLRVGSFPEDDAKDAERARLTWQRGLNAAGRARQLAAIFASGSRREGLGRLRAPALVIHGRLDPLVPVDHGIMLASLIRGARLHIVEEMGHALPIRLWPQIVELIAGHAGGTKSRRPGGLMEAGLSL